MKFRNFFFRQLSRGPKNETKIDSKHKKLSHSQETFRKVKSFRWKNKEKDKVPSEQMQKLQTSTMAQAVFFFVLTSWLSFTVTVNKQQQFAKNIVPFFFVEQLKFRRKLLFTAKVNRNFFFLQTLQPLTHFFFLVHLEHMPTNLKNQEDPIAVYFKIKSKQQKRNFWFKRFILTKYPQIDLI